MLYCRLRRVSEVKSGLSVRSRRDSEQTAAKESNLCSSRECASVRKALFGSRKDGGYALGVMSPMGARHASRCTVVFVGRAVPDTPGRPTDGYFMLRCGAFYHGSRYAMLEHLSESTYARVRETQRGWTEEVSA